MIMPNYLPSGEAIIKGLTTIDKQRYEVYKGTNSVGKGFNYIVCHVNESGYTRIGFYYEITQFKNMFCAVCSLKTEKHIPVFFNSHESDCLKWLLDNHKTWLDEQFEKAFNNGK